MPTIISASVNTASTLTVWRANVVHQRAGRAARSSELGMNVMARRLSRRGTAFGDLALSPARTVPGGARDFAPLAGVDHVSRRAGCATAARWTFVNAGSIRRGGTFLVGVDLTARRLS